MAMYLRFVTADVDPYSRAETGIFRAPRHVLSDAATPAWISNELDREYDWFNEHLPVPDTLWKRIGRRGMVYGVCWFRAEARECVSRARYISWLLCEAGLPVREIRTSRPGEVLCRDDYQVVANAKA